MATYIDKLIIRDPSDENLMANVTDDGKLKVEIYTADPESGQVFPEMIITDIDGHKADVTEAGRLLVSDEPPEPPAGTIEVDERATVTPTKNGGYTDTTYTITNGYTLYLQRFAVGTEATEGKFELYYDPDGDMGVNAVQIRVAYLNVSNYQYDLNNYYDGDGTARIVMRATNNTALNNLEFFNAFSGYEQVTA